MLSLNLLKRKTRRYGLIAAKALGILILIFVLYKVGFTLKEIFFPSPPPAPETAFGVLPKTNFPQGKDGSDVTYNLDTLTGDLPSFPHLIKIYEMKSYVPSLLDLENTQKVVNAAGFPGQGTKLSDTSYAWIGSNGSRLTVDILTKDFTWDIKIGDNESEIKKADEAISIANSFKEGMFPPEDLDNSKTTARLLLLSGSAMIEVESLQRANLIAVNYFQNDIDDYPIVYPQRNSSTMTIFVGKGKFNSQPIGASFYHQYVGQESSTYPLISSEEALNLLKNGEGYIANSKEGAQDIKIKKIYIGYYIGEEKQNFLMPVAVFEGEDFLAYVPAVKAGWLSK